MLTLADRMGVCQELLYHLKQGPFQTSCKNSTLFCSNGYQRFYKKDSTMSHGIEGGDAETFVGQKVRIVLIIANLGIGHTRKDPVSRVC
jgi:hypothetical protein